MCVCVCGGASLVSWERLFFFTLYVCFLLTVCRHSSGFWHERERERERDRERDRERWSPRRRSRSPHFRDRRHSRSNTPPHRSPRRWMTPPLTAEERERQKKGIPPPRDKHCTGKCTLCTSLIHVNIYIMCYTPVCTTTIWMGHLAKTVKQAQIMAAFEDFGQVKSVDVSSGIYIYVHAYTRHS